MKVTVDENFWEIFPDAQISVLSVRDLNNQVDESKDAFPLVHIDTGHNFQEALDFRDNLVKKLGERLIVRKVEDTIKAKGLTEPTAHRRASPSSASCTHH